MFEMCTLHAVIDKTTNMKWIDYEAGNKGHLISEQICEDIDFSKSQRKYC